MLSPAHPSLSPYSGEARYCSNPGRTGFLSVHFEPGLFKSRAWTVSETGYLESTVELPCDTPFERNQRFSMNIFLKYLSRGSLEKVENVIFDYCLRYFGDHSRKHMLFCYSF